MEGIVCKSFEIRVPGLKTKEGQQMANEADGEPFGQEVVLQRTGFMLARVLTCNLSARLNLPYEDMEKIVCQIVQDIADDQVVGDWLETPNETTYTMTFKPRADPK